MALFIDRYRIVPRIVLTLYIIGCIWFADWYFSFEEKFTETCNAQLILGLVDRGVKLEDARSSGCSITGVVGRPNGYTALAGLYIGAGPAIFGFYVNSGGSGRKENE